jgi:S-adenosylmethionine decarboxylase
MNFEASPPDITCGFEGAEKKIEVEFKPDPSGVYTLRSIPQSRWETILDLIHCQIVSSTKNEHLDSYVLSESSLFVYPHKTILKTCGTTTLLACMDALLELAKEYNLEPDFFWYARKNFKYPEKQLAPHTSFDDEVRAVPLILHLAFLALNRRINCTM